MGLSFAWGGKRMIELWGGLYNVRGGYGEVEELR